MTARCWRCNGREGDFHKPWCKMPGGCHHCGWSPHRWWCADGNPVLWTNPSRMGHVLIGAAP